MRLFVTDHNGIKRHLNTSAVSRQELASKLGGQVFVIDGNSYHVSQVTAEKSSEAMAASAVIGGAMGLVGGMPGVLIGGALGALFGNESEKKELAQIASFNRS
ncbi:hypothetical protein [Pseudoalteromonas marina]|uniref:hypothetical protein n=1 Tax=Pseudoalteromonas marina TaxID=267375 RepID=UPI0023F01D9A|nr:hypothetical protein [Pseudoalteromonas marina]